MADNTIIQQGTFVSTGLTKTIMLRSDIDWIRVYNWTNSIASTQWAGVEWFWQREMGTTANDALTWFHAAANSQVLSLSSCTTGYNGAVYGGVSLIDSSSYSLGAPLAVTVGTNVTAPVFTATTTGLNNGNIVRIYGGGFSNLNGLDFTVNTVTATNFTLANTLATAPGQANGAGFWRLVAPDVTTYNLFYPAKRVIANITRAAVPTVTTLVDHNYQVGQTIRMNVPTGCGMTELDGQLATVVAVTNAGQFTISINTAGYTAFAFPVYTAVPFTPAECIPVADYSPIYTTNLAGALVNQGYIGAVLATSPTAAVALGSVGGTNGDVIYWQAGRSFATSV